MELVRIAVLLACHNRRDSTLNCLSALHACVLPSATIFDVFLVDDGSTDGTAAAVLQAFPRVNVIAGDGTLFWNRGMRLAFEIASRVAYDFYLWLNDDVFLDPDALVRLIDAGRVVSETTGRSGIIVGSTRDPVSGVNNYGGLKRTSVWRPMRFELVPPSSRPVECDTINGNCVLISAEIAGAVGNLDTSFRHAMGDIDYGLRSRQQGIASWVAPGFVGTCPTHDPPAAMATKRPLMARMRQIAGPKQLPPKSWATLVKRHAGPAWPVYWANPYVRALLDIGSGDVQPKSPGSATVAPGRSNLPDFFIIGGQKCATTFLADVLRDLPGVFVPPGETPFFQDPDYGDGALAPLERIYASAPQSAIKGLKRPTYLGHAECAPRIARAVPQAKLIAVFRDPVIRAVSAYYHQMRMGLLPVVDIEQGLTKILDGEWDGAVAKSVLEQGLFGKHISHYLEFFSRSQIHVELDDVFHARPADAFGKVCAFLGIDAALDDAALTSRSNVGVYSMRAIGLVAAINRRRFRFDDELGRLYVRTGVSGRMIDGSLELLAGVVTRGARKLIKDRKPVISNALIGRLKAYYRSDIELLERSTGLDLSGWKDSRPSLAGVPVS